MKTFLLFKFLFLSIFFFSGCSNMLMPYKDEFRCNKGVGSGYCASMTENYEEIQTKKQVSSGLNKTTIKKYSKDDFNTSSSALSSSDSQKCEDIGEAIWLKQRELEKKIGIK